MFVYKNSYPSPKVLTVPLYCCNFSIFLSKLKMYQTSNRLKDLVIQGLSLAVGEMSIAYVNVSQCKGG